MPDDKKISDADLVYITLTEYRGPGPRDWPQGVARALDDQIRQDVARFLAIVETNHITTFDLTNNGDPKEGDIVREKKYAQPLEVVRVDPEFRQAEVVPQGKPAPKRTVPFEELKPYKKE